MKETEYMVQRAKIEIMLKDFTKEEQTEILTNIEEFKSIIKTEDISDEIIALLIFLYKKNK